ISLGLKQTQEDPWQRIVDTYNVNDELAGKVTKVVTFGAFVDLDGIDGLIHISELSWSHVNHPSEILNIGDTVQVKVLDIDRDRQRISLGLKQTQEDPWQRIVDTYNVNDELAGKVTKVVTFGAFVEVLDGVEGLVHISELAGHHVESPREIVHPGDEIRVKILEIDSERRRLSLSAKRVEDQILPLKRADGEAPAVQPAEDSATLVEPTAEEPQAVAEVEQASDEQPQAVEEPAEQASVEPEVALAEDAAAEAPAEEPVAEAPAAEVLEAEDPAVDEPVVAEPAGEEPQAATDVETAASEDGSDEDGQVSEQAPVADAEPTEQPQD
ncbi:MAG TPA: S1 RNA-binding domain-containing protein, partial [Solirubrobacteraceae bacterium]|nr:S1 RNA-binding domain-containing protein [Solirubrobacteraceae bacterium]